MAELPESFSAPWTLWNGVNGLAYAYMLQLKHSLHREFGIVVGIELGWHREHVWGYHGMTAKLECCPCIEFSDLGPDEMSDFCLAA